MENLEQLKKESNQILNSFPYGDKEASKIARKKLREIEAQTIQLLDLKPSMVFYESWGYDQTNIDFLEVVEVSPTKKSVMCRMIGKKRIDEYSVAPDPNFKESALFRLLVGAYGQEIRLRGSYPFCNGGKREGSFSLYTKPVYETPEGMGH